MVIYFVLLSLIFLLDFHLTPRRVSLINLFSIGLPAFIIALKNDNYSKMKHFMTDLISFVIISAIIITAATYTGEFYIKNHFIYSRADLQMVMMSIMIITTISNFLSVVLRKNEKHKLIYFSYAFFLLCIYIVLAISQFDNTIFITLKEFYEVTYLRPEFREVIIVISLIFSVFLFTLQKLRDKIIFRFVSK
jgi:magnesium-transporting ATPase (P-type)